MKTDIKTELAALIKDGVLDLSDSAATYIDASGLQMVGLTLPECAQFVDVRNCRQLAQLTLPSSVREADVSGCDCLKGNLVMKGLPERLILAHPEDLYAWSSLWQDNKGAFPAVSALGCLLAGAGRSQQQLGAGK